ncbi:DUF6465 family protein [Anaerosacchariphilus polymeriproducens]|uniref:Uncharacterized protein n=1 Tax=Anaerosacchariphilus polymeriproducens TaxID=1812858 RepID=A0A371AT89_9FIRM|nr:DUF6465 family protein [Anaerosacchariphilus polymeriproducens]RDU22680.1 hypothetical protein DWV06_12965 [Anaerosacchariphilus polymeriproducens]
MSTEKKQGTAKPLATTAAKPAKKSAGKESKTKSKTAKIAFYIQYEGKEINYDDMVKQVKEVWVSQGNKISHIKTLDIYAKPEEMMIYYVINEEFSGSIPM